MKIVWNPVLATPQIVSTLSVTKPAALFQRWAPRPEDVCEAGPVTSEHLARVHDLRYVNRVLTRAGPNGFGNKDALMLHHILAANGVMVRAVHMVATEGVPQIVCAPVSGFHHAGYAYGGGYCTFNGLLAAIQHARMINPDSLREVLIIDGDGHYGDGTDDILRVTRIGGVLNVSRMFDMGAGEWRRVITEALQLRHWDLILYQAGADSHVSDPYGVGYLSDDAWRERDEMIFGWAVRARVSCVWNLAGGYGPRTLDLHTDTYRTARAHAQSLRWGQLGRAPATAEPDVVKELGVRLSSGEGVVQDPSLPQGGAAH